MEDEILEYLAGALDQCPSDLKGIVDLADQAEYTAICLSKSSTSTIDALRLGLGVLPSMSPRPEVDQLPLWTGEVQDRLKQIHLILVMVRFEGLTGEGARTPQDLAAAVKMVAQLVRLLKDQRCGEFDAVLAENTELDDWCEFASHV